VIALESLIIKSPRPDDQIALIDDFIAQTESSMLAKSGSQSLAGALREMKKRSISASGKDLVSLLDGNTYMSMTPRKFWDYVYKIRSTVSHGTLDPDLSDRVSEATPDVEKLLRDLIDALARG
jgi:hypothetical protein